MIVLPPLSSVVPADGAIDSMCRVGRAEGRLDADVGLL